MPPIIPGPSLTSWALSTEAQGSRVCRGRAQSKPRPQALALRTPTCTVSRFLPWKVTSVSWFTGMTSGLGFRNWGQSSSWGEGAVRVCPAAADQLGPPWPQAPHHVGADDTILRAG